jgi:hypothetical protein
VEEVVDDIRVERDGQTPEDRKNFKIGCLAVIVLGVAVPLIIVAIPLVAGLYRWAFGG